MCAPLAGAVVEIGFGSGLNLPRLPPAVESLAVVEPSQVALRLAQQRRAVAGMRIDLAGADGCGLELSDESADAVLCMWTLCGIRDPGAAPREVRRVLRPGGMLRGRARARAGGERLAMAATAGPGEQVGGRVRAGPGRAGVGHGGGADPGRADDVLREVRAEGVQGDANRSTASPVATCVRPARRHAVPRTRPAQARGCPGMQGRARVRMTPWTSGSRRSTSAWPRPWTPGSGTRATPASTSGWSPRSRPGART
ncbi:class I SAM-dependent methyltransferase [Motilibacter sp. K478]|nr:class I SAM-dependent methyltransferase [Motilibacter aurantiacus]